MANYYQEEFLTTQIPEADLNQLIHSSGPAISIFINTQRVAIRSRRDRIKLKNFIAQAEKELVAMGHQSSLVSKIVEPIKEIEKNILFWKKQGESLVVYAGQDFFRYYRLPYAIREGVLASYRFQLKPILQLLSSHFTFYLLSLSQKKVQLFQGSPYHLGRISGIEFPDGADLVPSESRKNLNFRSLNKGSAPTFHGHGGAEQMLKDRLSNYFQAADRSLNEFLKDKNHPLVLASVDYFLPIYRKINKYPLLVKESIKGSPDKIKPARLHQLAWCLVDKHFLENREQVVSLYKKLAGSGHASNDISEIVLAARQGRIKSLLVSSDQECWGRFNEEENKAVVLTGEPGTEDIDLLDLVASEVFGRGQSVYVVPSSEMPDGNLVTAIFHY
jgi:hypothetical protein